MSRISKLQVIAVLVAAITIGACSLPEAPSPIINISNNLVNTVTLSSPVESSKPGCPAIAKIQINHPETLFLATAPTGSISATPKDVSGKDRAKECDLADGITWSPSPQSVLSIVDNRAFETTVKALATGDVTLTVTVGTAAAAVRFTVKP